MRKLSLLLFSMLFLPLIVTAHDVLGETTVGVAGQTAGTVINTSHTALEFLQYVLFIIWIIVGLLAIIWLWQQISKK